MKITDASDIYRPFRTTTSRLASFDLSLRHLFSTLATTTKNTETQDLTFTQNSQNERQKKECTYGFQVQRSGKGLTVPPPPRQ
jgi:hypothetical protein